MKALKVIFLSLFVTMMVQQLHADVAREGEVDVQVQLMNAKDFPKMKFYIKYQDYYYEMGWQTGNVSPVYFESGKPLSTGERGDASLLYAEDENGHEYTSKLEVGGVAQENSRDISYFIDQIKITDVKGDEIRFKVVSRQKVNSEGKVIGIKKGEIGGVDGSNWMVLILPIACLLGLVGFFLFRKRTNA